ncbi:hypothetical protein [Blastopirellula marina]|uniref:hypothetical protein n=1 Tax=Blastopirellula marina TaxID=124 RepID=UPI000323F23A|nr:hypothetical protein [Blastopirellula marina]
MNKFAIQKFIAIAVIIIAAASVGCSRGPVTFTVSGTVTVDGTPVNKGYVIFSPVQGSANSAVSGEVENGSYTLKCIPGEQKVTITGQMVSGSIVPLRYLEESSDLSADVGEDKMTINFDLTSKVRRRR